MQKEAYVRRWSPTSKARGTSIEIPSYACACAKPRLPKPCPATRRSGKGRPRPPVAESTEASTIEHMNHSATFYAFIHPSKREGLLRRWIKKGSGDKKGISKAQIEISVGGFLPTLARAGIFICRALPPSFLSNKVGSNLLFRRHRRIR
jgi:hypothetical protein